jgi:hypothetical protein
MCADMYVHVSSNDSASYYTHNTSSLFRVKLNNRLDLKGSWVIGVCDVTVDDIDVDRNRRGGFTSLLITCDICTGFIVNGVQTRTLRTVPIQKRLQKVYPVVMYVPIETYSFDTMEFRVLKGSFEEAVFIDKKDNKSGSICMTLHLKQT